MGKVVSDLNEIITLKNRALQKICGDVEILKLMSNNPNLDIESEEAEKIIENNFYDYSFSDETFQTDNTVILVEAQMVKRPSMQMKRLGLFIQILSNRNYVALDKKLFKGVMGNRNDNIAREIATLLDECDYKDGIGDFILTSVEPKTVPQGFSSIMLEFEVADY